MKKWVLFPVICLLLCGCVFPRDPVLEAFPGLGEGQVWTSCGFQDYTDYGKYTYSGITSEMLEDNQYFQPVTQEDIPTLLEILKNYEGWLEWEQNCEDCEVAEHYDFSADKIRAGDYFYLYFKYPDWPMSNYDLYYFSVENQTLYFFHNNI